LDAQEPIDPTDDVMLNIESLTELVQDMSESPLVRAVGRERVLMNQLWQSQIFATQNPQPIQEQAGAPPSDAAGGQAQQPSAPPSQEGPAPRVAPVEPIQ
jgi:hypothetical protein